LVGPAPPPARLAWLVWGLGAGLYLIAFFQRVAPAVLTRELSSDFELSAAGLGNLSAFYFYSYVVVQIPTGLLADRWGPRRLLTVGAGLTALGTLLFALAPTVAWANAGRLAIGAAVGVAFVSMLKLATHWMPARRFVFTSGVALFVGVMGATLAGVPLRWGVEAFGWRAVMAASALVTAALAVAIWMVVRDDPVERGFASYYPRVERATAPPSVLAQLREVLSYPNTWLLFFAPGAFSGIVLTFAGLWGVPFLVTQHGFTVAQAAATASAMLVAWSAASMVYGPISERLGRRKPLYAGGLVATMALWALVILWRHPPPFVLVLLLIALGISSAAFIVTFAFAKESVPARLAGSATGIANMGVMLGGMIMQPLVGLVLDHFWLGRMVEGARIYDFYAYRWGFALMLAWGAASLVLIWRARETYCRPLR
jgi:MFS family permease